MEIVFRVVEYNESIDATGLDENWQTWDVERGLCKTVEIANMLIEKKSKKALNDAMDVGDGAWISAYPAESIDYANPGYPAEIKKIMRYDRRTGTIYIKTFSIIVEKVLDELS